MLGFALCMRRSRRSSPMGKTSRNKGGRGEREACTEMERITGIPWRRSVAQTQRGGQVPDIVPVDESHPLNGLHVEVKRNESLSPWAALEQAEQDSKKSGGVPVVLMRKNRKPWTFLVRANHLPALMALVRGER